MVQRRGRRGAGRRCLVDGCRRRVGSGYAVCRDHARTEQGAAAIGAVRELADRVTATAPVVAEGEEGQVVGEFARRMARGDYGTLLDEPVREVVRQAGQEAALAEEIGALRVAVKRLLMEETDAAKMALGLSRAAHALARLLTVEERRRLNEPADDPATARQMAILRQLIAVE